MQPTSGPTSSRLRKRRKRSVSLGESGWKRAFSNASAVGLDLGQRALQGIRRHPRLLGGIVAAGLFAFMANGAAKRFEAWHQARLPTSVEVQVNDSELRESISSLSRKRLEEARSKKRDRAWLLERLRADLAAQARIAQFWVRMNLSGKLQVNALPEIPFALLEAAGGEKLLVTREGKVLTKNLSQIPSHASASSGLLVVELPELKFITGDTGRAPSPNLNLAWVLRHAEEIARGLLGDRSSSFRLARLQWRAQSGFLLSGALEAKGAGAAPAPQALSVQFADGPTAPQLERLQRILTHLRSRNLSPTNIDLNFKDKALIQLSGAASPMEM